MIAFVNSKEDAIELNFIYKISLISLRARKLGRDAYKRMKKGDFTNTPKITDKVIEKIIENEIKHVKGYDINAE